MDLVTGRRPSDRPRCVGRPPHLLGNRDAMQHDWHTACAHHPSTGWVRQKGAGSDGAFLARGFGWNDGKPPVGCLSLVPIRAVGAAWVGGLACMQRKKKLRVAGIRLEGGNLPPKRPDPETGQGSGLL